MRDGAGGGERGPAEVIMAAERKTKLSKNLLRMKVRGAEEPGWEGGTTRSTWPV